MFDPQGHFSFTYCCFSDAELMPDLLFAGAHPDGGLWAASKLAMFKGITGAAAAGGLAGAGAAAGGSKPAALSWSIREDGLGLGAWLCAGAGIFGTDAGLTGSA